jgi:hypothetical protein
MLEKRAHPRLWFCLELASNRSSPSAEKWVVAPYINGGLQIIRINNVVIIDKDEEITSRFGNSA